jgi:hypothetical protein
MEQQMLHHFLDINLSHLWQLVQGVDWPTLHGVFQSATDFAEFLTALKVLLK